MLRNIAKGAFLLMLALMIVTWTKGFAESAINTPPEPLPERIYS